MSLSITDLQPKSIKVNIRGVELVAKPIRLKEALILTKVGDIFQNPKNYSSVDIEKAQNELDDLFASLIPELKGTGLDINDSMSLLSQLMQSIEPADNKELKEKGVSFEADPKAEKNG